MFERFTEEARRAVFFARYEASQAGSREIGTEHLLLGLIRDSAALAAQWFGSRAVLESIRREIEAQSPRGEKASTSLDLPLSHEAKRVMVHAAKEADRLKHKHIGPEHLMLGLLKEENSLAAKVLKQHQGERAREMIEKFQKEPRQAPPRHEAVTSFEPRESPVISELCRDLTAAAEAGSLHRLVGRERDLEAIIQVLGRRSGNSPALIGEPGVGKTAIVGGLAQRIADGHAPEFLLGKRILDLDTSALVSEMGNRQRLDQRLAEVIADIADHSNAILLIDGLFEPGATTAGGLFAEVLGQLLTALAFGRLQCIATGTPAGYREAVERDASVERHLRVVRIAPPSETEAVEILRIVKQEYETYHQVTYADGAMETAVLASVHFMPRRYLPAKALELMDEAGVRVKLRPGKEPADGRIVTSQDIEELISQRAGLPVEAVRERLKKR